MARKYFALLAMFVLAIGLAESGSHGKQNILLKNVIEKGGPVATADRAPVAPKLVGASITWTVVDSMANAFGPASRSVKAMAYDPATNTVALIHRGHLGYAAGSGQLWYNTSRNGGATWRRVSELNAGISPTLLRYPGCTISNPTNSSDTANALFVWAAPELLPGGTSFGAAAYGVDAMGAGTPFSVEEPGNGTYWSNLQIWAASGVSSEVYWTVSTAATGGDFNLWHTSDFVTITQGVPATWTPPNYLTLGRDLSGGYRNGKSYFSVWSTFPGDLDDVTNVGYSTSTDNGTNWSGWTRPQPDWRSVPGMSTLYDWWYYGGPGVYSYDMLVDANGRVHFFGVIQDSTSVSLPRSVVEIYETGSGWGSKIIQPNLTESTVLIYPGAAPLNQMGNHLNAAISPDGNIMTLFWLDAGTVAGDSLADIWFSYRHINGGAWSTPENLTQTPGYPEMLLHVAPKLKSNGGNSYTAFLGRVYQIGLNTWPPISEQPTYFFTGSHTFTVTSVGEGSTELPEKFRLEQNYPNPFNPSTQITYSLPIGTRVRLSVYNTLGQEVATLVDGFKDAGTYTAEFKATSLSSGVYFYSIKAGQFSDTKKLLLVK